VSLINGVMAEGAVTRWSAAAEPDYAALRRAHYAPGPSFEEADVANVRDFGARGDGQSDDTAAFVRAIAAHDKVFVPNGSYRLSGTLRLGYRTHLFGFSRSFASIGGGRANPAHGEPGPSPESDAFTLETMDDAAAAPGLSFLTVQGRVQWRSGRGTWTLNRASTSLSGQAGGRFYGLMAMGRPLVFRNLRNPTSLYGLNVERITTDPQSEIKECSHIRVYYFKVEAGTIQRANAGDGNTPCRISGSRDVRDYCMYGNVMRLDGRPMLDIVDSAGISVSQLKAFNPGPFAHIREKSDSKTFEIPSGKTCALYVRE
jgi:hypothetical protein